MKGDTVTGGTKVAKLETGAVVKVPLFLNEGEVIRVDTRSGEYIARAKEPPRRRCLAPLALHLPGGSTSRAVPDTSHCMPQR